MSDAVPDAGRYRIDRWLWCARFYKTRSLAAQAIAGGKAHLNGARVKPAHTVRIGDTIGISLEGAVAEFTVLGLPLRRGPAVEARGHYEETAASRERRARLAERRAEAGAQAPRPALRPDKRERRELRRLQRGR